MRQQLKVLIDDATRLALGMYLMLLLSSVLIGIPVFYILFFVL